MANDKLHHEKIYRGADYAEKFHSIIICGAGAIGSNLCENLVRTGAHKIKVIDFDRVEKHNLSTQIWTMRDVGQLKVVALCAKMFTAMETMLDTFDKKLDASNAKKVLNHLYMHDKPNLIVDAFDNSASRKLVKETAAQLKVPCLHCGVNEDYGQVTWSDVYKVPKDQEGDVCDYPLARNIINLTVAVATEEILDFFLYKKPRHASWSITLRDFAIRRM